MRIHSILHGSRANGPGLRSVVWTQGCALACPGCQNSHTHDFAGGQDWNPEALAEFIVRNSANDTVGLTISGGEPMQQAVSLYRFICMIQAMKPDWDIGMFSGYTLRELTVGEYDLREEIPHLRTQEAARAVLWDYQVRDRLTWGVFGRFDATRPTLDDEYHHRLCSSANQYMTMFRRRWTYDDFPSRMMEVNIGADGFTQISGFPPIKEKPTNSGV